MRFLVDWFRIDNPRNGQPMNVATVCRDLRAHERTQVELRRLNESLERRVAERTGELADANEKLVAEMVERERADMRLQELQLALSHAGRLSAAGQMAAALAHELNQPLTAVANSASAARRLLMKGEDIGTVREIVDEIAGQSLRAGQIIRRLRDFVTRGESERQIESVTTLIEEARAFTQASFEALGIQAEFGFDPNATEVFANRIQVQQVLVNMMRNAFEAMAGGQRRQLKISTNRLDEETIEIAVADSGPGLTKEVADQLFEPFVTTKRDGMGLGLSICRSIVESHGGRLWAEANPSGGMVFRFTLPAPPPNGEFHAR
jgi:C4-dicarboxylate-specific signal transduction histidine kinase